MLGLIRVQPQELAEANKHQTCVSPMFLVLADGVAQLRGPLLKQAESKMSRVPAKGVISKEELAAMDLGHVVLKFKIQS